jgi:hypothetical protein
MFATLTRPESYVRIAILPFFTVTIASAAYAYSGQELAKDARIDLSKAPATVGAVLQAQMAFFGTSAVDFFYNSESANLGYRAK